MKKEHLLNIPKHFKTICIHKYWVYRYCKLGGITWRGIKHDLSKFSPIEFFESIKYYTGTSSPIDGAKKAMGYSKAWFHHRGRNDHHYEMWQDNFDKGGEPIQMPFECAVELICDYLGAARVYMGKDFSYQKEFEWFQSKLDNGVAMHIQTKVFVYRVFKIMAETESRFEKGDIIRKGYYVLKSDMLRNIYYSCKNYDERGFKLLREIYENNNEKH